LKIEGKSKENQAADMDRDKDPGRQHAATPR